MVAKSRRHESRRKSHKARKARKKAVKDRHVGHRSHVRTVNAPHTW